MYFFSLNLGHDYEREEMLNLTDEGILEMLTILQMYLMKEGL